MDVVIITLLFGVLGILIGYKAGSVWGASAQGDRQYWMRNLAFVLVGIALSAVVSAFQLVTLVGLAIGLIGGGIAGLKLGYGQSVGVWQKHDRVFRVNKEHLDAAASAKRAREEGMTARERSERELISVDGGAGDPEGR